MSEDPRIYDLLSSMLDEQRQTNVHLRKVDGRLELIDGRLEVIDGRLEVIDGRLEVIDGRLEKIEDQVRITNARLGAIEFVVKDEHDEFRSRIARVETALVQHGLMTIH